MSGDFFTHNDRQPAVRYCKDLTDEEWIDFVALKNAIPENPSSVHPEKMEYYTELLIKTNRSVTMATAWRTGSPLSE